jgi:hypothetical protein
MFSGVYFMAINDIFELTEENLERQLKLINDGKLPDVAYVNNTPLYLQKEEKGVYYSWDKLGEKRLGQYSALDTVNMFLISLEPPVPEAKK